MEYLFVLYETKNREKYEIVPYVYHWLHQGNMILIIEGVPRGDIPQYSHEKWYYYQRGRPHLVA